MLTRSGKPGQRRFQPRKWKGGKGGKVFEVQSKVNAIELDRRKTAFRDDRQREPVTGAKDRAKAETLREVTCERWRMNRNWLCPLAYHVRDRQHGVTWQSNPDPGD